jgi:hypothetical protein
MNKGVAHSASLVLLCLIMRRPNWRLRWNITHRLGVALEAKQIHLADLQQPRVRRTVRHMTTGAAFGFDWQVLEYERPLLVPMALEADLILFGASSQLLGQEPAVLVVAVTALNQTLLDPVAEWPIEFGSYLGVALVAQLGLLFDEQRLLNLGFVGRMATDATHVITGVGRAQEIGMLVAISVAIQAALGGFLRTQGLETDDLCDIAATLDVGLTGPVTGFTALMVRRGFLVKYRTVMGSPLEMLCQVLVTGFAGVGADVLGGVYLVRWQCCFSRLPSRDSCCRQEAQNSGDQEKTQTTECFLHVNSSRWTDRSLLRPPSMSASAGHRLGHLLVDRAVAIALPSDRRIFRKSYNKSSKNN